MADFGNQQNWNLLRRENYQVIRRPDQTGGYSYEAIRDIQTVCRSPILMIGISSSTAQAHWSTGGWASMMLPILPSSTTDFVAAVRSTESAERCELRKLNLIQFPYLGISPYILNLAIPHWLEQASIEVWQYGENIDGTYEPPNTELYRIAEAVARPPSTIGDGEFNLEIEE